MIKVVLLDDEKHCVESLAIQLKKFNDKVDVVALFTNPNEAFNYLTNNQVDLLFLDVEMPGMNGFDLLNKLEKPSFEVVFTTAYDKFAIKAFRISAFDYLLKPIAEDDLGRCINNFINANYRVGISEHIDKLMELLSSPKVIPNKIAIPASNGLEFVEYRNIVRIESDSNYSVLYLNDKTNIVVCRTLKEMEEMLEDFNFIRIHHSHIINPDYLQKFLKQDGGYVVMNDGSVISVSRSRKESFLNKFPGVQ